MDDEDIKNTMIETANSIIEGAIEGGTEEIFVERDFFIDYFKEIAKVVEFEYKKNKYTYYIYQGKLFSIYFDDEVMSDLLVCYGTVEDHIDFITKTKEKLLEAIE